MLSFTGLHSASSVSNPIHVRKPYGLGGPGKRRTSCLMRIVTSLAGRSPIEVEIWFCQFTKLVAWKGKSSVLRLSLTGFATLSKMKTRKVDPWNHSHVQCHPLNTVLLYMLLCLLPQFLTITGWYATAQALGAQNWRFHPISDHVTHFGLPSPIHTVFGKKTH